MIIDFRYHIASLVAVFIALGVGIFIGSTLVGEDIVENLVKEQKIWIGKLEADYINLKKETQQLSWELNNKQKEVEKYKEFLYKIKPSILNKKLIDKKFLVIEFGNTELNHDINNLLELSGASVVSTTNLFLKDIKQLIDTNKFSTNFVDYLLFNSQSEMISRLEKENIIKKTGIANTQLDGVIIISNSGENLNSYISNLKILIAKEFSTVVPVYIIEKENFVKSEVEKLQNIKNLYFIDNFNTITDEISFILNLHKE